MGTFTTSALESTAKEKDFFTLVYNAITGIDENITMDLKQWDSTQSAYVTINDASPSDVEFYEDKYNNYYFILDSTNDVKLILQSYPKRGMNSKVSSNCYNIRFNCGTQILAGSNNMGSTTWIDNTQVLPFIYPYETPYGWADVYCYENFDRKIIFSKYESDGISIYWFAPYSATDWRGSTFSFTKFKDTNNNLKWAAGITGPSAFGLGSICNATGSEVYDFTNMFSYEARTGYLDFISHTNFLSGGTKAFSSADIYDCTTVNFGDTLSLKDGANFLAIGSHSMVPLS